MNQQQHHEMVLEKTHLSSAEEWHCPICGRRMLLSREPKFRKIVLDVGDEFATHSGGKGGLGIGLIQVATEDDTILQNRVPETLLEDVWLVPWMEWMDEVCFKNLWNK